MIDLNDSPNFNYMMKQIINCVIIILIFLLISCKDENPTITETGKGRIVVESNVEKGEIFLEGIFSGLYTPDTLELLAVTHSIKVRKEGYFSQERKISFKKDEIRNEYFELYENNIKKNVLIENVFYADCDTCSSEMKFLNNLKEEYGDRLQIVNYPYYLNNPDEKLYIDVKFEVDNRFEFYNIVEINNPRIDGIYSNNFEDDIENRLSKESKMTITISDTITQTGVFVLSIFLDVYDLDGLDFNNLALISAIIENDVVIFREDIQSKADFVLRSMFSNPEGISLNGITKTGRARFAISDFLLPNWKKENLMILVFVQNRNSKEVLQVGTINLNN